MGAGVAETSVGGRRPGLVTVVVPAYNIERYVVECLDSVLAQTAVSDITLIVIDDGSTDGTPEAVAQVSAREPRVRLVRQTNQGPGPGAARNHGLDLVTTEYVMFCDGDDQLTPTAVERLRDGLERSGLDLAVGASEQFPEPRTWLWTPYFVPGVTSEVSIEDVPLLAHNAASSNKMFRTAALRASGRRFAEGIHHQDTVVTVTSMVTSQRLVLVGDVVHRYRKRPEGGSIMDSHYTRLDNFWDHLKVIETLGAELDAVAPARRPLLEAFIARSFQGFAWRAPTSLPADRQSEFFQRTRAVVGRLSPEVLLLATRDATERAAYVTMLEDDLGSFRHLPTLLERLVAHDGHLYLDVPTSSVERRELLRLGRTRAHATGLSASRTEISFDLAVRVQGALRLAEALEGVQVQLRREVDAEPVTRPVQLHPGPGHDLVSRVCVSRPALVSGSYELRLVFATTTGRSGRWVRRPRGAIEERVRLPWSSRHLVLTERDERALLIVP